MSARPLDGVAPHHLAWLRNSLRHPAAENRKAERMCRKAYTKPPYSTMCTVLADAHAAAAEVFERALRDLDAIAGDAP